MTPEFYRDLSGWAEKSRIYDYRNIGLEKILYTKGLTLAVPKL